MAFPQYRPAMNASRTYRTDAGARAPMPRFPARIGGIPNAVKITDDFFNDIEDYIRDLEASGRNITRGMDFLAQLMARANQGFALDASRGPVDPYQKNSRAAWKIPVRRITQAYYRNWKVKRLAPGIWQLYNDSREAYYIEFGISFSGRRVRRPIRKITLIKTLRWADQTNVGHRVWEGIFAPLRNRPMAGRGSLLATTSVQSPKVMTNL